MDRCAENLAASGLVLCTHELCVLSALLLSLFRIDLNSLDRLVLSTKLLVLFDFLLVTEYKVVMTDIYQLRLIF